MKRKFHLFVFPLCGLFFLVILNSCNKEKVKGDDNYADRIRVLSPFNGIVSQLDCEIRVFPRDTSYNNSIGKGNPYYAIINAPENIDYVIETPVESGNLVIKLRPETYISNYNHILVTVIVPDLAYLEMNSPGSVSFYYNDMINHPYIECINNGPGTINFHKIRYRYMKLLLAGSGYVFADSICFTAKMDVQNLGSGSFNLLGISADTVSVLVRNDGDVSVFVRKYLDGTISGSGNILYQDPDSTRATVKSNITGTGKIIRL